MFDTRSGNTSGVCTASEGCANGQYFMDFNIANQSLADLDPVVQMRTAFDAWRKDIIGITDAVQSTAVFDRPWIRANGIDEVKMTITLRDWKGNSALPASVPSVVQSEGSDALTIALDVQPLGGGVYEATIGLGFFAGEDTFDVVVNEAMPVVMIPKPKLLVAALADIVPDGSVDLRDQEMLAACMNGPKAIIGEGCADADVSRNNLIDLYDFARLQANYTNTRCKELSIVQQPQRQNLCVGDTLLLEVDADADPEPTMQWLHNGMPLEGEVHPTLVIPDLTPANQGYYTVMLTNTCGILSSEPAAIRVSDSVGPCAD